MQRKTVVIGSVLVVGAILYLAYIPSDSSPADAPAAAPPAARPVAAAPAVERTLADEVRDFRTAVSVRAERPMPLPTPPAALFVREDYASPAGETLPAFVTPDPRDGRRHPAIIWLTGGESNSLDDFWTAGPESNDQSVSAFRGAGVVMYFPTLRGGNTSARGKEYLLGEVDDVLAAAAQLKRLPYVDTTQVYLGGHSTGGTLVLLAAERGAAFRAIFAFGPVATADRYPESLFPIRYAELDARELRLRSPIHWLQGIASPTYLIEGGESPGNRAAVEELCAASRNPQVHCILAAGSDHFSVLSRVTRVIAARMSVASEVPFALRAEEFGGR